MLRNSPYKRGTFLWVDDVEVEFSLASEGTKVNMHAIHALLGLIHQLGDYGHFSDSGNFCVQGNLFSDLKFLLSEADTIPRQTTGLGLGVSDVSSLPNNSAFNSFLASLAPRLTNSYLVTRVSRRRGEFCA